MVAQVSEDGHQIVVVYETSLLICAHGWVETWHGILQHKGELADERDIGGSDGLHELSHVEKAELPPLAFPEGSITLGAALNGEGVFGIEYASALFLWGRY